MVQRTLRVLVLEDNVLDEKLMLEELRLAGMSVESRRVSTEEAYRAALDDSLDLVLADYTLPGFDAKRALQILKDEGLVVPFIVVTGTVGEEAAVSCMRAGAADYLLKDRLARLPEAARRAVRELEEREAKRKAEAALTERFRFESLLASISARLINTPAQELDAAIVDVLRNVGEAQGFDRTVVMLLDDSGERFRVTHEWHVAGMNAFAASGAELPIREFGTPFPELRDGLPVVLRRRTLPAHAAMARAAMDRDALQSLVTFPLRLEGVVIGCVGFSRVLDDLPNDDELVRSLNLVGEVVSNALGRQRSDERRRAAFEELETLKRAAERERDYLREEVAGDTAVRDIAAESPAMRAIVELIAAVASTKATVLIRGESGVGKELIARAVHAASPRADRPLVKVNCASIPKELFESEFFGHVRGSFTGAHKDRVGRFELADGGTIFLDEVGELPLDVQAKLLRVLQESELERVGEDRTRRVDVRVIAATNRDLDLEAAEGRFRPDLYYRLNVFPVLVPPLRERLEDIVPMAEHFLKKNARDLGRVGLALSDEQKRRLQEYDWPGNVRELQHVMERAAILSRTPPLRLEVTSTPSAPRATEGGHAVLTELELRTIEVDNLKRALDQSQGRISGAGGAAELLGVRPSTLRDRMKAFGIQRVE